MRRNPLAATCTPLGIMAVLCCAGGAVPGTGDAGLSADSLVIEVQNQDFYDATIHYAFGGGTRLRLGTVTGNSQGRFTIRWDPRPLHFTINFVGAGQVATDDIQTVAGEIVGITLPPNAHRSQRLRIRE